MVNILSATRAAPKC